LRTAQHDGCVGSQASQRGHSRQRSKNRA
jgi:hypothetical protein